MTLGNQARQKLSSSSYFAILGGIGLGISLFLPYLQFTFLITISFTAFELGGLVWMSIGVAAVFAILAGMYLSKNAKNDPKILLIFSIVFSGVAGFFTLGQIRDYNQDSLSEMGYILPLSYGIGLIIATGSVGLITLALILVLSNQQSIEILRTEHRSRYTSLNPRMQYKVPFTSYSTDELSTVDQPREDGYQNFCPNCGYENTVRKPFCIKCGAKLRK
ncbi:MAG: zinc-ribbon domain-containing protein [Candidatus Hodarchaeales archaeon]|jgi:hypothetical protein